MALCWSLDKIGPMCRYAEDTALVLSVLNGHDPSDAGSLAHGFAYDANQPLSRLTVGYDPRMFQAPETTASDSPPATDGPIIEEQSAAAASYAGSASCQGCHAEETEKWRQSHHHFAERPYDADMDGAGFDPPHEIAHGTQNSKAALVEEVAAFVTRFALPDQGNFVFSIGI